MGIENDIFQRTELLLGKSFIEKAAAKRVIIFGIGGVGSWCAESLIRSGIGHLTIVDSDRVSVTNINRQLLATTKTVGKTKTEVLKERLLEINPKAEITALQKYIVLKLPNHLNLIHTILSSIASTACPIKYILYKQPPKPMPPSFRRWELHLKWIRPASK